MVSTTTGRLSNNTSSDSYLQPDQQQHQWSKLLLAACTRLYCPQPLWSQCASFQESSLQVCTHLL